MIKEVLAKYKIHLLTACEDLNHRMKNFSRNYKKEWMVMNGKYSQESYYFHSFAYRILSVFAWIDKIQKEMIFLDTTISTKEDLEFIKFLKVFPQIFCDFELIEGRDANGDIAYDHFFRNNFGHLPNSIITDQGQVMSYSEFLKDLSNSEKNLKSLYEFLDGISPEENRKRWDRIYFLNLTLIIFLNHYGYDFQMTNEKKIEAALSKPKVSDYLEEYFYLFKKFKLHKNPQVKKFKKVAQKFILK
jgi:hypothetical protein